MNLRTKLYGCKRKDSFDYKSSIETSKVRRASTRKYKIEFGSLEAQETRNDVSRESTRYRSDSPPSTCSKTHRSSHVRSSSRIPVSSMATLLNLPPQLEIQTSPKSTQYKALLYVVRLIGKRS